MPMPHAQCKSATPSPSSSDVPKEDAPCPHGNTPPPQVIAVPSPKDTAPCRPVNPSVGGNVKDAEKLQWSDLDMVLLDGIPDIAPGSLPTLVRQLHSQGVVPLEMVTYRALLDLTQLDPIHAHGDYPEWDHCVPL